MNQDIKSKDVNVSELLPRKKDEKTLNIYYHVSENSGVGYYRQYLYAKTLSELGLANVLISDFRWGVGDHINPSDEKLFALANWADIFIVGRLDTPNWIATWGAIRDFFKIPVIVDTDDNVRFVRPSNPGYQGYHPGSEAMHWNRFSIQKVYDALTVSTDNLKQFHKNEHQRIFVVPNSIDFKHWDYKIKKKNDGFVHLNFNGSAAHTEGIDILKKPLLEIMRKYPHTVFSTPHIYEFKFKDYPENIRQRLQFMPWFKLKEFPKKMAEVGPDIGLAPLCDNLFNRAKSNLRWMEYTALGVPVVCSRVEAYKSIKHRKTGLFAIEQEEWYNGMAELIESEDLRISLAKNAHKELKEHFNIEINAPKVIPIYREIIKKYHSFYGEKKLFAAAGKGKWREQKFFL